MDFKRLEIERSTWGDRRLKGQVSFGNDKGRINLNLNEDHINKIFEIVAETMIETAKEASQELTCNIIEHKELLDRKQV